MHPAIRVRALIAMHPTIRGRALIAMHPETPCAR
jgi:hypothetical protein